MILMVHLLIGAVIVLNINYLPLGFGLAFLSHYLLDVLPHWDYCIENIKEKKWKNSFKDFLKICLDICSGILIIFIFSKNFFLSLIGGLVAVLPDGFILLNLIYPNKLLIIHKNLHQKTHFPKGKKISPFWGITIEIIIFFLAIYFLLQ